MTVSADIAKSLAALGHEVRLAVFRLLVKAGPDGLSVGEIGAHMAVPASTLAHHLGAMVDAGLVVQERRGRTVINRADYAAMHRTVAYLTDECCTGVTLARDDAA